MKKSCHFHYHFFALVVLNMSLCNWLVIILANRMLLYEPVRNTCMVTLCFNGLKCTPLSLICCDSFRVITLVLAV